MVFIQRINNFYTSPWVSEIDTKTISDKDIEEITKIEQDMWAREEWLWEYVRCKCCQEIYSKENIFWHLERKIKIQTVAKIEELLWSKPKCLKCWTETTHIFGISEYMESVRERYRNSVNSFLTVYRDEAWTIRWFFDWYVDNFSTIYYREFEYYYSNFWIEWIKKLVKNKFWFDLPDTMLMCSALWMEEWYKNFNILYEMMRNFFSQVREVIWDNITWIYESSIWTNTHSIYHVAWWRNIWLSEWTNRKKVKNVKDGHISDIFIHEYIPKSFLQKMEKPPKHFLRDNKEKMREILKIA